VAHEGNLSLGIKENTEWNSAERELLVCLACSISDPVLVWSSPSLLSNVILDSASVTINAESANLHLATPLVLVLLNHLLIVSHWSLAWWTPGGPEIDQVNSARLWAEGSGV